MRIAICDDEAVEQRHLHTLVDEWARKRGVAVSVCVFDSAEAFLFEYVEDKGFDVLLLDIQMKRWTAWLLPSGSGRTTKGFRSYSSPVS